MSKVKKRRKKKVLQTLLIVIGVIFLLGVVMFTSAWFMVQAGQRKLRMQANAKAPSLIIDEVESNASNEPEYVWKEGWVRYNGDIYEYNEDILTFLVLGIDKTGTVKANKNLTNGGQSDAIFLLVVNPRNKTMSIYAVDRNTMAEINMVGVGDGGMDVITTAQIAVQHGFGDGKEGSCELTRDAVSKFLFDLPIHGYISVNYDAIPLINDAVGGVTMTIPEDLAKASPRWKAGDKVLLKGQDAILFVRWRDMKLFESARLRSKRQKSYLTAFVNQAIDATKQDLTMPINLYNKVKGYTVTDITVDEMAYLASELVGYRFSGDQIYSMEGETKMGEKYEEFYPDMDALKAQMIELFYEKVEP